MVKSNYDTHFLQTEGAAVRTVDYTAQEDGQRQLHKVAVPVYTQTALWGF